jgi:hypothetical protein
VDLRDSGKQNGTRTIQTLELSSGKLYLEKGNVNFTNRQDLFLSYGRSCASLVFEDEVQLFNTL